MPKTKFDPSNVRQRGNQFPTVKLESDATWRVVVMDDPSYEWAHRLEKPKYSNVNGKLLMREIKYRNGDTKQVPDLAFIDAPRCLGNIDVLEDKGLDKNNCPVCAAALAHPDYFSPPERKYAVPVLKYATQGNSPTPVSPLSLEVKVWRLTEARYAKVVDVIQEFGGDATQVDLILGPCTNQTYQNYEIKGSNKCVIAMSEAAAQRARETFEGNNPGDLADFCAKRKDEDLIRRDIQTVLDAWGGTGGANAPDGSGASEPDFSGTLANAGADLLGDGAAKPAEKAPEVSLDDTLGAPAEKESVSVTSAAPAAVKEGEEIDFATLMAGLDDD